MKKIVMSVSASLFGLTSGAVAMAAGEDGASVWLKLLATVLDAIG